MRGEATGMSRGRGGLLPTMAIVTSLFVGCSAGSGGGVDGAEGPDGGAATEPEVARFEDGRLSFEYPADWEVVEQGGPDEYRTRLEPPGAREREGELPTGAIVVTWPFIANWSLDAAVGAWGPDEDDPLVSDITEEDVTVPGAEAAVAHAYRVRDATRDGGLGEEPATFRSVIAMGDIGRTVTVLIGAPDDSDVDVDEVADLVIGSLELEPTWE